MMTRRAVSLLCLTTFLSAFSAVAQQPPERERGFRPDAVFQFKGFDSVSLFNGNLNLTIPIAEYPVSAGLSYSFVLRYSGNLWASKEDCVVGPGGPQDPPPEPVCGERWSPHSDIAGIGWGIGFGDLLPPTSPFDGSIASMWRYRSADHSEHPFYDMLHGPRCSGTVTTNCDEATGVGYTRDGTYLRLKGDAAVRVVEFADGQRQRFVYDAASDDWQLQYIYAASSSVGPDGIPTSNWVRFEYPAHLDDPYVLDWRITDSHGREHYVYFQSRAIVDRIEVAAVRLAGDPANIKAKYDLTYVQSPISKPCSALPQIPPMASVYRLTRIDLPNDDSWQFTYNAPGSGCDDFSGTLTQATLPTLGTINWTYQRYALGSHEAIGVASRALRKPDGEDVERTVYENGIGTTTVKTLLKNSSGHWQADSKTVNYFDYTYGRTYGLPFNPNSSDGSSKARRLSSEHYDCDPENTCSSSPERRNYVKYEMDYVVEPYGCAVDLPCERDRNRRVVTERTVFVSDGNRYADTDYSLFDGLGHYRQTNTEGNFTSGNQHESYVGFNRNTRNYDPATHTGSDVGTYSLNNDTRTPGFSMLSDTDSWVLSTFSSSYEKQGSESNTTEACFDPITGFLERRRTLADTGGSESTRDLLTVNTRDSGSGYASHQESFGGDLQVVPTGTLCTLPPSSLGASSFSIDHTFQYGVLKTSRYSGMAWYAVENSVIDQNTGLVRESRDAAGLATGYLYDRHGRLTQLSPPGLAATTYTYVSATASAPARVEAVTGSGTTRLEQQWEFDPFGRIGREKRLMPSGWAVRRTAYNGLGLRESISEWENETGATYAAKTTYANYDAFGRVGAIRAPDDTVTNFTYAGARKTTRTYTVARDGGDAEVSVEEEFDRAGRLTAVTEDATRPESVRTEYAYDPANHLALVRWPAGASGQDRTFVYDGRGFLTQERHPESGATSYKYDAKGNVIERTTPEYTLHQTYDRAGRLTLISQNGVGDLKEFAYDRPNSGTDFSLGKTNFALRHNRSADFGDVIVKETYTWGGLGGRLSRKRTEVQKSVPATETVTFDDSYTWDQTGNLGTITYPGCVTGTCTTSQWPARTITPTYKYGMVTNVAPYTISGVDAFT